MKKHTDTDIAAVIFKPVDREFKRKRFAIYFDGRRMLMPRRFGVTRSFCSKKQALKQRFAGMFSA